jgi:ELWxxDGT repeat protein
MPFLNSIPRAAFLRLLPLVLTIAAGLAPSAVRSETALTDPQPVLVGDYSPGTNALEFAPGGIARVGNLLYFVGYDPQHGAEPWVSDGTVAGTRLLADLCPGTCRSLSHDFKALGDKVVFLTLDAAYAVTGGQVVELARHLYQPRGAVALGGIVYFQTGLGGAEAMWRTDGTVAGTRPSPDFCIGEPYCLEPIDYTAVNGEIYFSFAHDRKLYVLAAEGDRRELAVVGYAQDFTALDATRVVFRACDGSCSAWVTDGTAAGTRSLEPVAGGSLTRAANSFVAWRGRIYFANQDGQMVSTDGTPAGTRHEDGFSGIRPVPLAANGSRLIYTVADNSAGFSQEVLRSRHQGGEDVQLAGPQHAFQLHGPDGRLGEILFIAGVEQLIATDGTIAGTAVLAEQYATAKGVVFNGLYYYPFASVAGGLGMWRSNGTVAGTAKLDLGLVHPSGSVVHPYRLASSLVAYIEPASGELAQSLYRIDRQTFEIALPLEEPVGVTVAAAGKNRLYGRTTNHPGIPTLFAVGETSAVPLIGTSPVVEAKLNGDDHLFFTTKTPGQKLFASDGTAAGSRELFDMLPGYVPDCSVLGYCEPYFPNHLTPSGDRIFFIGESGGPTPSAYWTWQPGQSSPTEVHPLDAGVALVAAPGGRAVFAAKSDPGQPVYEPHSLWLTDGTAAGTHPFYQLPTGHAPYDLVVAGNKLFFDPYSFGRGLAVSDLTTGETRVIDLSETSTRDEILAVGEKVFYTGWPGDNQGKELGVSDSTIAGTRWIEIKPGPEGSTPSGLFALDDGRVVFAAAGDAAGNELWISDGTPDGTRRLTDLAPGPAASTPRNFAQVGQRLYFEANDGVRGAELWTLDILPGLPCPQDRLCVQGGRFEVGVTATVNGQDYRGQRVFGAEESGVFSFFSPDNWELLVKVLEGCGINQNFWVFASAASDVSYVLEVRDRWSNTEQRYTSSGTSRPILDSAAFATCGEAPAPAAYLPAVQPAAPASRCADDPSTLCLGENGRYRVHLEWNTAAEEGQALPVPNGSADSGLFTFFSPGNWEMMVKVLDGCGLNGKRWVFAAGTTDVGWNMKVTDRQTGAEKTYSSLLGQPSKTVTDTEAFDCN